MDDGMGTLQHGPELTTHDVEALKRDLRLDRASAPRFRVLTSLLRWSVRLQRISPVAIDFGAQARIPLLTRFETRDVPLIHLLG